MSPISSAKIYDHLLSSPVIGLNAPPDFGIEGEPPVSVSAFHMSNTALVLNGRTYSVSRRLLIATCDLFENQPNLLTAPYPVRSHVSRDSLELFLSAIDGHPIPITKSNHADLTALCNEFGYSGLASRLSILTMSLLSADPALPEVLARVAGLERLVGVLLSENARLEAGAAALRVRCEALEQGQAALQAQLASLLPGNRVPAPSPVSFHIFLRDFSNRHHVLGVSRDDTVKELYQKASSMSGIPVASFSLLYEGKVR
jgi:hypothetical protein